MSGDRTEEPTPRKREEARKRGQVARSTEITSAAVLFAGLLLLNSRSGDLMAGFRVQASMAFQAVGTRSADPQAMLALAVSMVTSAAAAIAPVVLGVGLVGACANLAQVGPMLTLQPLTPDFSRVNPLTGFKRMFSMRALVELLKSCAKLTVMAFVAYQVVKERLPLLVGLQVASAESALASLGSLIMELGMKCGLALLVMAAVDYAYQRRSHEGSLRMTKQEVKEEYRHSEGNPHLKSKLRQVAQRLASGRMMQKVPTADVVVTNPTHFAVALEYKPESMGAPVVVAKGQDLVAERIKKIAREHGVPIVENPPVARALYRSVEIGGVIPPALYQAVAEVLAFIYRLRNPVPAAVKEHRGDNFGC